MILAPMRHNTKYGYGNTSHTACIVNTARFAAELTLGQFSQTLLLLSSVKVQKMQQMTSSAVTGHLRTP